MYHHRLTLLIVVPCYRTKKDSDFFRIYYLCYNRDCTLYSFIPLKSGPKFSGENGPGGPIFCDSTYIYIHM